jgi:hypothetical protein
MHYEHLVEINDPILRFVTPLTREQLWDGLVRRAYSPQQFIVGLEGSSVSELSSNASTTLLRRQLDYGNFCVDDTVRLDRNETMTTEVQPGAGWSRSRLIISIEEPVKDHLFLRFLYEWEENAATSELDDMALAFRRQAYLASDLDTVARIREIAQEKQSAPPHALS